MTYKNHLKEKSQHALNLENTALNPQYYFSIIDTPIAKIFKEKGFIVIQNDCFSLQHNIIKSAKIIEVNVDDYWD